MGRERADGGRERAAREGGGWREGERHRERAMDMSCPTLRDERDGHWLTLTAQSPSKHAWLPSRLHWQR